MPDPSRNTFSSELRREIRIAFSRRAQPVWFRVVKWVVIVLLIYFFWRRPLFWGCMAAIALAAIPVHLFYRYKTAGWTRPWGGWNDIEAGK